jgi:hypothetical protein
MNERFNLYIDLQNDAFQQSPETEIARILRDVADRIEHSTKFDLSMYRTIRDINGNDVGRYAIKPESENRNLLRY